MRSTINCRRAPENRKVRGTPEDFGSGVFVEDIFEDIESFRQERVDDRSRADGVADDVQEPKLSLGVAAVRIAGYVVLPEDVGMGDHASVHYVAVPEHSGIHIIEKQDADEQHQHHASQSVVPDAHLLNCGKDSFDRTDHLVKNLVHQFGLLFFRNIHYRFESAAGEPAGFGVGRPAAWQDKHTGVGP